MTAYNPPQFLDPWPGHTLVGDAGRLANQHTFVSGDSDGDRLRVLYYKRDRDGALGVQVWFGPGAEVPPMHAHGGSMAALLDEAMGLAAWLAGYPVLTASMTVSFRAPLPLGSTCLAEAFVERAEGRRIYVKSKLYSLDGKQCYSEGSALFVILRQQAADNMFGEAKTQAAAERLQHNDSENHS